MPTGDTPERLAALREIAALIQEALEKTGRVLADKTSADSGGPAISSPEPVAREPGAPLLLDVDEQTKLFARLQATLNKTENCDGARDQWSVIERALLGNPGMMRSLKRLQDMGAELVVTDFQSGQNGYVEFADAAANLDIRKQGGALAGLASAERDSAIEQILQPLDQEQREPAKKWILSQLTRSKDARGLNYVEALLYSVVHGGRLIAHEEYDAMARRDPRVEDTTWTWYLLKNDLSEVMQSGVAPFGGRLGGKALRGGFCASGRGGDRGGRVAGLRVQIS